MCVSVRSTARTEWAMSHADACHFPADDPSGDVWIEADDRIIDGRLVRTAPRIMMFDREGFTPAEARQLAAALLNAADVVDEAL